MFKGFRRLGDPLFSLALQRRLGIGERHAGASYSEINASPDPITPSLDSELVLNGGFTSDTANWTAVDSTLASVAGGQSGNGLQITNSGAPVGQARQPVTVVTGEYYFYDFYHKSGTVGTRARLGTTAGGNEYFEIAAPSATWVRKQVAVRVTSTTIHINFAVNSGTAGNTTLADTVSLKKLLNTASLLGDIGHKNGTYICRPTVSNYTMAGIDLNYKDDDNLVRAVLDRGSGSVTQAKLASRIGGTWTAVVTGTVVYSAAAELKVVVNGTTFQLFYNGVQVGADQVIDNSTLGTSVRGFNTLAGNTVGTVTTTP